MWRESSWPHGIVGTVYGSQLVHEILFDFHRHVTERGFPKEGVSPGLAYSRRGLVIQYAVSPVLAIGSSRSSRDVEVGVKDGSDPRAYQVSDVVEVCCPDKSEVICLLVVRRLIALRPPFLTW